jgi:hypothetical protein
MIDLHRNSKKELIPATGIRSRQSSIYKPYQAADFKISRSKFNDFLTCRRCFILDRKYGFVAPGTPGWTLNDAVDVLLKKEFDECRENQTPHRICIENDLAHLVPFAHDDLSLWRDSLHHGLSSKVPGTSVILTGGLDDVWQNQNNKNLVVVDYKSQASFHHVDPETYFEDPFKDGYRIQLSFYTYMLRKMGFAVDDTAYLVVANADKKPPGFHGLMRFYETLVPCRIDDSWIEQSVYEMVEALNSEEVPASHPSCKNCAYARQRNSVESELKSFHSTAQ